MKRTTVGVAALALVMAASLGACSATNPPAPAGTTPAAATTPGGGVTPAGTPSYAADGTFTEAMVTDPGALDPQLSIVAGVFEMTGFAYDSLVGLDAQGNVLPQLAASWTVDGTTATFTLNSGITCSDGSALTAKTVADNITWMEDVKNASPFLGTFLPAGATATSDATAGTVTLTLASPSPFLLQSLANVPIVCDAGLADRSKLTAGTIGSGPYQLTEAVPNDHYTYVRRDGYTWGPGGATTAQPGLPQTIVVKVVPNETTAVNLLLSGGVNLVTTTGPDASRAQAAGLPSVEVPANLGLTWYNHASGHATSDPAVRQALTQAVNFDDLAAAITGNAGGRATALAVIPPTTCTYDSVSGNVAGFDATAAGAALEADGYAKGADGMYAKDGKPLTLTFLYDSALGTTGQAAAELAVQQWTAAGITVKASSQASAQMSQMLFGSGNWDIVWEPINVNSPDQMVSFFSGPAPADGGANLSSIDNSDYNAAVADAMTKTGADACTSFQQAESALFKANDVIAWAVRPNQIFVTKNVQYEYVGRTQVTGLRLTAS